MSTVCFLSNLLLMRFTNEKSISVDVWEMTNRNGGESGNNTWNLLELNQNESIASRFRALDLDFLVGGIFYTRHFYGIFLLSVLQFHCVKLCRSPCPLMLK